MSTHFPVQTTSTQWPVEVVGMGGAPRIREGKMTPAGEPTYTSGTILLVTRKDGTIAPEKSATVNVIHPEDEGYELGDKFKADGKVYVQPYESGGRVAYSITVDRLIPSVTKAAAPAAGGAR